MKSGAAAAATICTALQLLLSAAVAAAGGASYEIPASDFVCSGTAGGCAVVAAGCGRFGGACVALTGANNGSMSAYSQTRVPVPRALATFVVVAHAKCESGATSTGTHYFGLGASHWDLGGGAFESTDAGDGWRRYEVAMSAAANEDDLRFGVGQWYISGTCVFDGFSVSEAQIVGFDTAYGPLGRRESVTATGVYTSTAGGASQTTNFHRQMANSTTGFNTNRHTFYGADDLSFDHALSVPFSAAPKVSFYINYLTAGSVTLSSSADGGASWTDLATSSSVGRVNATLPSASHTMVRMRSQDGSTLQINDYAFSAQVSPPSGGADVPGRDVVFVAGNGKTETRANISIEAVGGTGTVASGTLQLRVSSAADSSAAANVRILATPKSTGTLVSFAANTATLAPGASHTFEMAFSLSVQNSQIIALAVVDQSDSSKIFADATATMAPAHFLLDESYGELLSEKSGSLLWAAGATYKISKSRKAPETPSPATGVVSISAARNEYESVQLVVRAGTSQVPVTSITVGDLTCTATGAVIRSADYVTIREVGYVVTAVPTDKWGLLNAAWPDPLLPLALPFSCPAETNCPFWVTAQIAENVTAGIYNGAVTVVAGGQTHQATLQLQVYNFSIPKHTSLKSWFGFSTTTMSSYHNITHLGWSASEPVYNSYVKSLKKHRIAPSSADRYHGWWSTLDTDATGVQHWNIRWTDFDEHAEEFYGESGYNFQAISVSLKGMGSGTFYSRTEGIIANWTWGMPEHTRLFNEYAQEVESHLESLGLVDRSLVYWFDEPEPEDYEFVKEGMEAIKLAAPKLNRFLTEEYVRDLAGYVDIWCPVQMNLEDGVAHERKLRGEQTWTYLCCCPKASHLGLFIDHPAVDLRAWLWLVFREGVDGILVWTTNWFTSPVVYPAPTMQDPYTDPMSWVNGYGVTTPQPWGNGDGRFFYPPKNWNDPSRWPILDDDPVETVRLEILRDGIEDWEYLTILKDLVATRSLPAEIYANVTALLKVPQSIITSDTEYNWDPQPLLEARIQAAALIEQIVQLPPQGDTTSSDDDGIDKAPRAALQPLWALAVLLFALFHN